MENKNHKDIDKPEAKLLSNIAIFSVVNYLTLGLALLRGLIIAKLLGPAVYGIRNILDIVIQLSDLTHLGTMFAMNREVPFCRGQGDEKKGELMLASTFWANMLSVVLVGSIAIAASIYFRNAGVGHNYCDLMLFSGVLVIVGRLKDFYHSKLKIESEFYFLSIIDLITRAVGIVSCIVLAFYFYLRGFFIGLVISEVLFILVSFKKGGGIPRYLISIDILKHLIRVGFPIMIASILFALLYNVDKIMVVSMLSESDLGFYGIAMLASGLISIVPDALYAVTIPPLMKKYGQTNDIFQIKRYFVEPTVLIAYLIPFMLAGIYLAIHIPMYYFLTKYIPSIAVVKILTFGLFFSAVTKMAISVCFAIGKRIDVVYITILSILLNVVMNYLLIRSGMGINGVALGTGISYFFFSTVLFFYMLKQYRSTLTEYFKFVMLIYAPFVYSLGCILIVERIFEYNDKVFWADLINTFLSFVAFSVLYSAVFIFIRKDPAFVNLVDTIKQRLA